MPYFKIHLSFREESKGDQAMDLVSVPIYPYLWVSPFIQGRFKDSFPNMLNTSVLAYYDTGFTFDPSLI